jgi:hypothetical protein
MSTAYRINRRIYDIRLVKHKHFYDLKSLELRIRLLRRNTKSPLNDMYVYTNNLYYIITNFLKDYESFF